MRKSAHEKRKHEWGEALLIRESRDLGSSLDDRFKEPQSIYGRVRGPETGFRLQEITSQGLFKRAFEPELKLATTTEHPTI